MNTIQLKSFLMAYETRNLVRCASNLYITQSAISQQIKRLEEELGTELFVHRKGSIVPTHSGDLFYPYAKQAIESLSLGIQVLNDAVDDSSIDIYCFFYNGRSQMSELVSEFCSLHPAVNIKLHTIKPPKNGDMQEDFKQNSLYFSEASWNLPKGMHFYKLYTSHCICVMQKDNPLSCRESLDAGDILGQTVYLPNSMYPATIAVMQELNEKLPESNKRKSNSFLESVFNVNISGGVFICPEYLFSSGDMLAAVPYKTEFCFDVGFSYFGNLSSSMKLFLNYMKKRFANKQHVKGNLIG